MGGHNDDASSSSLVRPGYIVAIRAHDSSHDRDFRGDARRAGEISPDFKRDCYGKADANRKADSH
jgi:hypothetical protein